MGSKVKEITPAEKLIGDIDIPGDKSISHRAVMLGALAKGRTTIEGLLYCDDTKDTIHAFKEMGISIEQSAGITLVEGKGLRGLKSPKGPISVGSSGTTMRILPGILASQDFATTLTGDESLSERPMKRIVEPLSLMGASIEARNDDYPPITIRHGALKAIDYTMPVASAQVKSAILFAGLYAEGITAVRESFKSRDHTERMMKYFGADIKWDEASVFLKGGPELKPSVVKIPGDISSASFFMVGAILLKGSRVRINEVGINPTRAGILDVLSRMGARVKIVNKVEMFEPVADIVVEYGQTKGMIIEAPEIPRLIDELPIIFVLAALSRGRTVIKGAKELRVKETDRIDSMMTNLAKMGANIALSGDEITIDGVESLTGAPLLSFGDHRTCMSMAIAALAAKGQSTIDDIECAAKSFPGFFEVLENLER